MAYTVERTRPRTLTIRFAEPVKPGFSQDVFLGSDVHWDSVHCLRRLFRKHMVQAKERNAPVLLFGDAIDGMQSQGDRRSSKDELDPAYKFSDYLDRLVYETAQEWQEFSDNIALVSMGNHEASLLKHNETNVAARLAREISAEFMGFSGYVRFMFSGATGNRTKRVLRFAHSRGGNSPVTRGVIGTNRRSVWNDGVDVHVTGDIHQKWLMLTPSVQMADSGRVIVKNVYHVQTGTYQSSFDPESDGLGWGDEKDFSPPLIGGWWLKFRYNPDFHGNIEIDVGLAQ